MALLRHLVLALFLVLGQLGAASHAVGHLAEHHHDQAPHGDTPCAQCLAYAHMGAALPTVALPPPGPAPVIRYLPVQDTSPSTAYRPVYLSRAPPTPIRAH